MRIPRSPLDPITGLKKCLKCGKEKPGEDFRRNRHTLDGSHPGFHQQRG